MKPARFITCRKRSKNCFEIRFIHKGKTICIYGKTAKECRENYQITINDLKSIRLTKRYTFSFWYEKWIDLYKKPFIKPDTLDKILSTFRIYILPYIQDKNIKLIRTDDIQAIINRINDKPRTQTIAYLQINACFTQAFKTGLISYNPCSAVMIKKNKGNKGKALTQEQYLKLICYLKENNPPVTNLIYIYLYTGMRRSELLNIDYKDLDFVKNEIFVHGTKTICSDRIIPTSPQVLALFPKKEKPFGHWSKNMVDYHFKQITKKLGFKKITIHSLRHTFATRSIELGADMAVVQQWLGHSSIAVTIDTYTHIDNDFKHQEFNKISNELIGVNKNVKN